MTTTHQERLSERQESLRKTQVIATWGVYAGAILTITPLLPGRFHHTSNAARSLASKVAFSGIVLMVFAGIIALVMQSLAKYEASINPPSEQDEDDNDYYHGNFLRQTSAVSLTVGTLCIGVQIGFNLFAKNIPLSQALSPSVLYHQDLILSGVTLIGLSMFLAIGAKVADYFEHKKQVETAQPNQRTASPRKLTAPKSTFSFFTPSTIAMAGAGTIGAGTLPNANLPTIAAGGALVIAGIIWLLGRTELFPPRAQQTSSDTRQNQPSALKSKNETGFGAFAATAASFAGGICLSVGELPHQLSSYLLVGADALLLVALLTQIAAVTINHHRQIKAELTAMYS